MAYNTFDDELVFEAALIKKLFDYNWEKEVLKNKTEKELVRNWADILFENNRQIDRLGNYPLTDTEMQQIIDKINELRTPLKLNSFINGKEISIKRDNPDDTLHLGQEVTLKIFDRHEISAGQSRYQIAEQPRFENVNPMLSKRRGDFMLLINGMPVIHVELKKSGVAVSQATNQIEKYAHEGVFSQGLFSLVQIFVAMNPEECVYFANPGPDGEFNSDYFFHWADFENNIINDWEEIAIRLLSIPMAHRLIGFYTVADDKDGILKVMRSYQYYATFSIADKVANTKWDEVDHRGGHVWHTTGSGKTMTSFKAAQLISQSHNADKVVFLMDRIELGTQSLDEYQNFADDKDDVQGTENTEILIAKLKNDRDSLIVTSIQKMALVNPEDNAKENDLKIISEKHIVFIVDECHRSTFGDMLLTIKKTFPNALYFGFTGTPIKVENNKKGNTTTDVFGSELHQYSVACGIRDKNVLGFDPTMVLTYRERDLRNAVALDRAKASTLTEVFSNPDKTEVYNHFMNDVPMAGYLDEAGTYQKGIEDYLPTSQYDRDEHRRAVVQDITDNWIRLSQNSKFHAIFATHSIPEACLYYDLFKEIAPSIKVAALFDPTIDNNGNGTYKEDALVDMLTEYNERYNMKFTIPTYPKYKKDVANRLAHKKPYTGIANDKDKQLDILIVVSQMLTGYDSKWVNTLYLDRELFYEEIIQAFSRTNRLFGPDKPFGNIRYYRKPFSMQRNIDDAFRVYAGSATHEVFVSKIERNIELLNAKYTEIRQLFESEHILHFNRLPESKAVRGMFAKRFREFHEIYESAKVQGFEWNKTAYNISENGELVTKEFEVLCDKDTYNALLARYKELFSETGGGTGGGIDIPYEIDTHITEINTDRIDAEYLNDRFHVFTILVSTGGAEEDIRKVLTELHKSFASLNQEEQKQAEIIIHDIQSGSLVVESGSDFRTYINEYMLRAKNTRTHRFAADLGIDEEVLNEYMSHHHSRDNRNEFGAFDRLKAAVDKSKAKIYIESIKGKPVSGLTVSIEIEKLLDKFLFG